MKPQAPGPAPHAPALRKRIKRHVSGRPQLFFIATAPGLADLCYDELTSLDLPIQDTRKVPGGIEFTGRLPACYGANLHLRTASRILMRLGNVHATNFRQLHKKIAALPWELYLYETQPLVFQVTTKHSRLYHTEAISETFRAAIAERLAGRGLEEPPARAAAADQQIFIRAQDDTFSISIDSSGTNLYKRALKKHHGTAPLRETIAAAVLKQAGYDGTQVLFDPMCGTGTFSIEAAMIASRIPAGWYREFAFMGWPAFSPPQWEYLKKEAGGAITQPDRTLIFASDQNPRACRSLARTLASAGLSGVVNVQCSDFFDVRPHEPAPSAGLVVLNPPYGRRLGTIHTSDRLMPAISTKLLTDFCGWQLALLVPHEAWLQTLPFALRTHALVHGGLQLVLAVGTIPAP